MFKNKNTVTVADVRKIAESMAERAIRNHVHDERRAESKKLREEIEARRLQRSIDRAVASALADAGHAPKSVAAVEVAQGALDLSQNVFDGLEVVVHCGCKDLNVGDCGQRRVDRIDGVTDATQPLGYVTQNTSPSRSGLSGGSLSSPTATVSENTSAGAVTPSVPAHPRFVAIGDFVYDRDLNQAVLVGPGMGLYRSRGLNDGTFEPDAFLWEDAK